MTSCDGVTDPQWATHPHLRSTDLCLQFKIEGMHLENYGNPVYYLRNINSEKSLYPF